MRHKLLDIRMARRALLIVMTALVIGALVCEPRASAAERGPESRAVSRYEIPGDGDAILIPVVVDGKQRSFILDTGSRITVLDSSFRRLLGKPVDVKVGRVRSGDITIELFSAPSIRIRGIDTLVPRDVPKLVTVADLGEMRELSGYNIEGILGMDVLQYVTLCIDPDEGCVSFARVPSDSAGVAIPLRYWPGKLPAIEVVAGGERVEALLDTGNLGAEGELDDNTFARLERNGAITSGQLAEYWTLGGRAEQRSGTLRELSLAQFVHHDIYVNSSPVSSIGMLHLSRYIVTLDFPRGKLYLKKSRRHAEPCSSDLSGMSFKRVAKQTVIESVDPRSAAEAAGLLAGDVIVQIGAMDAASERYHAMRLALSSEGSVNVTIRRGGTEIPVRLKLRKNRKTTRKGAEGVRNQ